jgi:hypothetical protein
MDLQFTICFFAKDAWDESSGIQNIYAINIDHIVDTCLDLNNVLRPIVAAIPLMWRFLQCIRCYFVEYKWNSMMLVNAGKYASAMIVVLFSSLAAGNKRVLILSHFYEYRKHQKRILLSVACVRVWNHLVHLLLGCHSRLGSKSIWSEKKSAHASLGIFISILE